MLDASALTLGAPATALPDAALAAAGLPSAQQMAADSLATDRALDPPSYSTEGTGDKTLSYRVSVCRCSGHGPGSAMDPPRYSTDGAGDKTCPPA